MLTILLGAYKCRAVCVAAQQYNFEHTATMLNNFFCFSVMDNTKQKEAVNILKELHQLATASKMDYLASRIFEVLKLLK